MFKRFLQLALVVTLVTTGAASAAVWYGETNTNFADATNWDTWTVPTNGDFTVKALPIGAAANECIVNTHQTNAFGAMIVDNGGVLTLACPDKYTVPSGSASSNAIQFGSMSYVNDGTLNVYPTTISTIGSVRYATTLYVGVNGHTGIMNIMPGASVSNNGTPTFGGGSSSAGHAVVNQWGDFWFNQLRLKWNGTGSCLWTLYPGAVITGGVHTVYNTAGDHRSYLNDAIAQGLIVSGAAGMTPIVSYDGSSTRVTIGKEYKAAFPSPAVNATLPMTEPNAIQTLSWVKPLPEDPLHPVTSTVYFGTDPNWRNNVPAIATDIAGNSVDVEVNKLQNYYWKVDSYDPNRQAAYDADPNSQNPLTAGEVWPFNTNNIAPTVSISAPYLTDNANPNVVLWLPDNASTTITSTVTDDGYPIGGIRTYSWQYLNTSNNVWTELGTADTLTTPVYTTAGDVEYRLIVNDNGTTGASTTRSFLVRVFSSACSASPSVTGWVRPAGELSGDCKVNIMDLSAQIANWLLCNGSGNTCN